MANVTGRISTLPGHVSRPPAGTTCDEHQDRFAWKRVQGETDSMGCEQNDLCVECYDKMQEAQAAVNAVPGQCDWCSGMFAGLKPRRDWEEGSVGPVYMVCKSCSDRNDATLAAIMEALVEDEGQAPDYWDDGPPGEQGPRPPRHTFPGFLTSKD